MVSNIAEWLVTALNANPGIVVVGAFTLIEIAPIKINPWSKLYKWIKKLLYGELKEELTTFKKDFQEERANTWRWNILDFANSCKNNRRHTEEEWKYVIDQIGKYEEYVKANKLKNCVMEEESKYLRRTYQECCDNNDFL